jgi:hypothetical protein
MSDSTNSDAATRGEARPRERRSNRRLRELIDEMLASLRFAANRDHWTDDERTTAAADRALTMETVRAAANARPTEARGPAVS